jgi:hypothetical protein
VTFPGTEQNSPLLAGAGQPVRAVVASRSISRQLAFAIFVGTTTLRGAAASAFTTGLHAAFYESVSFMVIAAVLSAIRGGGKRKPATASRS